jgi:hypothetical protein
MTVIFSFCGKYWRMRMRRILRAAYVLPVDDILESLGASAESVEAPSYMISEEHS